MCGRVSFGFVVSLAVIVVSRILVPGSSEDLFRAQLAAARLKRLRSNKRVIKDSPNDCGRPGRSNYQDRLGSMPHENRPQERDHEHQPNDDYPGDQAAYTNGANPGLADRTMGRTLADLHAALGTADNGRSAHLSSSELIEAVGMSMRPLRSGPRRPRDPRFFPAW